MKWWKVTAKHVGTSVDSIYYVFSIDWKSGAAQRMLFDASVTLSGMECDPNEVPWKVRARYEMTTEELRDALKWRGYRVVLR